MPSASITLDTHGALHSFGREVGLAEQRGEVLAQAPAQLVRRLGDVARREIVGVFALQRVELGREQRQIVGLERDLSHAFTVPAVGPIERVAAHVGGEKADAIEADLVRRGHRRAQRVEVAALNGAAAGDRHARSAPR